MKKLKIYFCALGIIGLILIIIGIEIKDVQIKYNYKIQKDSSYEVLLKKNEFYTSKTLAADGCYASKSIDKFLMNLKYGFCGSGSTNIQYSYDVTANLVGTVNSNEQNSEIWNRNFILVQEKNFKMDNLKSFAINEPVNIDYQYFTKNQW